MKCVESRFFFIAFNVRLVHFWSDNRTWFFFKSIFHPVKKSTTTTTPTEINVSFSLFLSIETLLFYWFCSIYSTRHCFTVPLSVVIHRMDYKDVLSAYPTCSLLICYFVRQKRLFDVRHALFENPFFQVFFFGDSLCVQNNAWPFKFNIVWNY